MPTEEAPWSPARRVLFRFAFGYLALFFFPLSPVTSSALGWAWRGSKAVVAYESLWKSVVPWVGAHVLRLGRPIDVITVSDDSLYQNVKVLCFVVIAAVIALVWSVFDRNRLTYSRLAQWGRVYVRLVLASFMFVYGGFKVIPAQMPAPTLTTLVQPFGDLTPYRLLWSTMGAGTAFQIFAGIVETTGGILLLTPGLSLLGAAVSLGAMVNVFLLNLFYDIPVKLAALHLIALSVVLLLPYLNRFTNGLILNRRVKPEIERPLFRRRRWNQAFWGIQWAWTLPVLMIALSGSAVMVRQRGSMAETNPLYGIWRVDQFQVDGQVRPALLTDDLRWQRVIFDSELFGAREIVVTIEAMGGGFAPYVATIDRGRRTLRLTDPRKADLNAYSGWLFSAWKQMHPAAPLGSEQGAGELVYERSEPGTITLDGSMNGHRIRATLEQETARFALTARGFSWINDEW